MRPFVVCAVLRGVAFDAARYNSFIDLQVGVCGGGGGCIPAQTTVNQTMLKRAEHRQGR